MLFALLGTSKQHLLPVRDFGFICETNTGDLSYWLALIMADLIFCDMCQFLILTARKDGADVEEGFLLAGDPMGSFNVFYYFFL